MSVPELSSEVPRIEILAAYRDYSDYDLVESTERARVFIKAARILLSTPIRRTASGGRGGEEVELEPTLVENQLNKAVRWLRVRVAAQQDPRQLVPGEDFRC